MSGGTRFFALMGFRVLVVIWLTGLWCVRLIAGSGGARLPIYLEESHAGSFYFLASRLDLDRPYTLVLFDAHSDASPIFNSDAVRTALRTVNLPDAETDLFKTWRDSGKVQCYNWIEPLMPLPFARVIWVPPGNLGQTQIFQLQNRARVFLDGHEEVCPRLESNLSRRYSVTDLARLREAISGLDRSEQPIVVSIDLDYFAGLAGEDLEMRFREVFFLVLSVKHLAALTFSISTPYLKDAQQAESLLELAIQYSCRVANAEIEFEPFASVGPDTSAMAAQLKAANLPVPKLVLDQLSESCRNNVSARAERLVVKERSDRWHEFVDSSRLPEIRVRNRLVSSAVIGRSELGEITIEAVIPSDVKAVRWYSLRSTGQSYSLSDQEFGFADRAPCWIYQEPELLSTEPILQGQELLCAFDGKTGYGVADVFAQVETGSGIFDSKIVRITSTVETGSRFLRALSAEFNLPYIFFGGRLAVPGGTGPEVGLGSDCANFIIHGLRQAGWQIPWSDAQQLIPRLRLLARIDLERSPFDGDRLVALDPGNNDNGVIIVFDNHVAALWASKTPGFLGLDDLVVHQLEGPPEILPLSDLVKSRRQFSVLTVPSTSQAIRILVAGDLMLGRTNGERIAAGIDVFRPWETMIRRADLALGNLECSICDSNLQPASKPYRFRAPPAAADLLATSGFAGMLVANNHTGDFGVTGFEQTISALKRADIVPIGGGPDLSAASLPARFNRDGVRIAVLGCADPEFCSPVASANRPGICSWDSPELVDAIAQSKAAGEFCVVLCHWNADNDRPSCRTRAISWIDAGAGIVIGSGPHHILSREMVRGRPVFYSIGNFLFDGGGPDAEWSRGTSLELTVANNGSLLRAQITAGAE
jgi:Bacterial capsule synthesis protein PGA_cap